MKRWSDVMMIGLLVVLAACASSDPVATVEAYLQAKVASDLDQLLTLSCADWESQARVEATSFESMNAELQGMACTQQGEQDGYMLVTCEGQIATVYNGEARDWPLDAFPYRLIQADGEWKMCGYYEADAAE